MKIEAQIHGKKKIMTGTNKNILKRERLKRKLASDPEYKKQFYAKRYARLKKRFVENDEYREKIRRRWREKKQNQRNRRGQEINELQRKNYHEKREQRRAVIKEYRSRKDPSRGLHTILKRLKRGDISAAEFLEYARAKIDQLNSLGSRVTRK